MKTPDNPDVTAPADAPAALAPVSGSVTRMQQKVGRLKAKQAALEALHCWMCDEVLPPAMKVGAMRLYRRIEKL